MVFSHLWKTVNVSLVYELVVWRRGAALVDAEDVLLGDVCKKRAHFLS